MLPTNCLCCTPFLSPQNQLRFDRRMQTRADRRNKRTGEEEQGKKEGVVAWEKAGEEGKVPVRNPTVPIRVCSSWTHPMVSQRFPCSPRWAHSTPLCRVCAAKGGTQSFSALPVALLQPQEPEPPEKREIIPIAPQSLHLWGLSVFTWNDCYCSKLELGELITDGRETSRNT